MATRVIPPQIDADHAPHRPAGHKPNAPAWTAVLPPEASTVVFAQFGVQHPAEARSDEGEALRRQIVAALAGADGAAVVEHATHRDRSGHRNDVVLGYWTSPEQYKRWAPTAAAVELRAQAPGGELGFWIEVLQIPAEHFETLHSTERGQQGVSHFAPIQPTDVHEYPGGARDRIAVSHADPLHATVELTRRTVDSRGRRVVVRAPENTCFIRTAQDWSRCRDGERALYLDDVAPPLEQGANFLRDNPEETGCISGRFVRELDEDGQPLEKTCFLGYFRSLGDLERWVGSHHTHAAIFDSFMEMVAKQDFAIDLALWHEVCVLPGEALELEYVNCHPETGFLPFFGSAE